MDRIELENAFNLEKIIKIFRNLMKKEDLRLGENSVLVYIGCSDDQSTTVLEEIKRHLREKNSEEEVIKKDEIYERRVFGGIFLPEHSYESLSPALHHIPEEKNKKLLVLQLTHIGYDKEKGFGYFVRYGHKKHTTSCGAICSLFNSKEEPKDIDLKYLKHYIEKIKEEKDTIETITFKLLKNSYENLKKELKKLAENEESVIYLFSGIEIDLDKIEFKHNDLILPYKLIKISKEGFEELDLNNYL